MVSSAPDNTSRQDMKNTAEGHSASLHLQRNVRAPTDSDLEDKLFHSRYLRQTPSPTVPDGNLAKLFSQARRRNSAIGLSRCPTRAVEAVASPHSTVGRVRLWVAKVVMNTVFDGVMLLVILLNAVALCLHDPRHPQTEVARWLVLIDIVFLAIFTIEMGLQILARGFWTPMLIETRPYLKDTWCLLDGFVVVTGYLSVFPVVGTLGVVKMLRVLRPMRSIKRWPGVRVLLDTLVLSIPLLADVLLLLFWLLGMAAIAAVGMYNGTLRGHCYNRETGVVEDIDRLCPVDGSTYPTHRCGREAECMDSGEEPFEGYTHFNNFLWALLTSFQIVTRQGWTAILYKMEDANGSVVCTVFVLSIIILGSYFALQLVTGLLTAKYTVTSTKAAALAKSAEMQVKATQLLLRGTQTKRSWSSLWGLLTGSDRQPTANPQICDTGSSKSAHTLNQSPPGGANSSVWRRWASLQVFIVNVVNNSWFERGVILLSIANAMLMGVEHRETTDLEFEILEYTNIVFCVAFSLEMVLLHMAHGTRAYWDDPWKATDGVVSLLGIFEVVCASFPIGAPKGINFTVLRLLRILRVLRSAKLLRRVPGLLELLESIPHCFLALKDYAMLLLLFLIMFAVLGVHLFGKYDMGRRNFNSFPEALLTLFVMLTGSNWYLVLWSSMAAAPGVWPGIIFCITWMFLGHILLSTVFLAILIENVSLGGNMHHQEEDADCQQGLRQMINKRAPQQSRLKNEGMSALILKQVTPEIRDEAFRIRQWLDLHELNMEDRHLHVVDASTIAASASMRKLGAGMLKLERAVASSTLGGHWDSRDSLKGSLNRIKTALAGPPNPYIDDAPSIPLPPVQAALILTEQDASVSLQPSSAAAVTEATELITANRDSIPDIPNCFSNPPDADQTISYATDLDDDAHTHPFLVNNEPDSMELDGHVEVIRLDIEPTHASLNSAIHEAAVVLQPLAPLPGAKPDALPLHSRSTSSCQSNPKYVLQNESIQVPERRLARFRRQSRLVPGPSFQRKYISWVVRALWLIFDVLLPSPDLCLDNLSYMQYNSLSIFSPRSSFRRLCVRITLSGGFELILMMLILFTCVLLTLESPRLDEHSAQYHFIQRADLIVTILFTCETLLKIIARGFIMHEGAYLRSSSDVLDFVIVTSALFSLVFEDVDASPLKVLRVMRALRPLKMVFRDEGMHVVVNSLWMAAPSVLYLAIFGFILTYIFAIIGVQLFVAQFDYCNDSNVSSKAECLSQLNYWDSDRGELVPRQWIRPLFSFDSVQRAMCTLTVITMMDGWETLMFQAMDRTGKDVQPVQNNQSWSAVYFILFVILSGMVWFNIFVGVVVNTYTTMQASGDGMILVTKAQKKLEMSLKMHTWKASMEWLNDVPKSRIRWVCWKMAGSEEFDHMIIAIVVMNAIMMASVHDGQAAWQTSGLKYLNYVFTGIYVFEAVVKIVGMQWRAYQSGWWNRFDFLIMIVSIIELLPGIAVIPISTFLRPLRIGRIFKLLRSAKGLRCLFNTLVQSLPAMSNVGSLLFLVCFVFAVMGMHLFGHVDGYENGAIGHHANFWYFGRALLTVIRIVTGDSWSPLLADLTNCNDGKEGAPPNWDCTVSIIPFVYFGALISICSAVLLNLVVAIIVEKFVKIANEEGILTDDSVDSPSLYDILSKVAFLDFFIAALKRKIHAARLAREKPEMSSFTTSYICDAMYEVDGEDDAKNCEEKDLCDNKH